MEMMEHETTPDKISECQGEYALLVENANEAILVAQDGAFVFSNPKAEALFGYSRAELSSRALIDFCHPADRNMVREHHENRLLGEPAPEIYPFRIVCRSGQIKWVRLKASVSPWKRRPAVLCFLADITQYQQAQEALLESEGRLRRMFVNTQAIISCSPLAIVSFDLDGNVMTWNDSAEKMFGWPAAETLGRPLPIIPPDANRKSSPTSENVPQWTVVFPEWKQSAKSGMERFWM
jgi:PAS domain S-box-containing protein